jgi:hypothetical protein
VGFHLVRYLGDVYLGYECPFWNGMTDENAILIRRRPNYPAYPASVPVCLYANPSARGSDFANPCHLSFRCIPIASFYLFSLFQV